MSIREQLEQYSKQAPIAAEVQGVPVYFRRFTSREYEEWIDQSQARVKNEKFLGMSAWFLVRALCDESGARLYKDDEQPKVAALDALLVDALIAAALPVCIPRQIDGAKAEKNLQTPDAVSGFD